LTSDRQKIAADDAQLQEGVADNMEDHDLTESESLLIGTNFGIVTHIETGPDGNLFVLRLSDGSTPNIGAIFETARAQCASGRRNDGRRIGRGSEWRGHALPAATSPHLRIEARQGPHERAYGMASCQIRDG
jgi:hypothetical protein